MMKRLFLILFLGAVSLSSTNCGYNTIQELDENVTASWAQVLNQYQRRNDLIPNLVNVVQGYAKHEKEVLQGVADARSRMGSIQATPDLLKDPEAFAAFTKAQSQMGSALSRLMMVTENYPNLKADTQFSDLQAQLEGTENRISVERKRFIDSVKEYNVFIRKFPEVLTAKIFGYDAKPTFQVEDEKAISKPPEVKF